MAAQKKSLASNGSRHARGSIVPSNHRDRARHIHGPDFLRHRHEFRFARGSFSTGNSGHERYGEGTGHKADRRRRQIGPSPRQPQYWPWAKGPPAHAATPHLDERSRRVLAAAEAKAAGYGGIAAVWRATGTAPSTIGRALRELADGPGPPLGLVRHPGGGRKPLVRLTRDCWMLCWRWLSRRHVVIRSRRCAGRARVTQKWP